MSSSWLMEAQPVINALMSEFQLAFWGLLESNFHAGLAVKTPIRMLCLPSENACSEIICLIAIITTTGWDFLSLRLTKKKQRGVCCHADFVPVSSTEMRAESEDKCSFPHLRSWAVGLKITDTGARNPVRKSGRDDQRQEVCLDILTDSCCPRRETAEYVHYKMFPDVRKRNPGKLKTNPAEGRSFLQISFKKDFMQQLGEKVMLRRSVPEQQQNQNCLKSLWSYTSWKQWDGVDAFQWVPAFIDDVTEDRCQLDESRGVQGHTVCSH